MGTQTDDAADRVTADKMLMAKLFRHLRNEGLEEKIQGLGLTVHSSRARVTGEAESDAAKGQVVSALGSFQGVVGVEDQLTVKASPAAPAVATPAPSAQADSKSSPSSPSVKPATTPHEVEAKTVSAAKAPAKAPNAAPAPKVSTAASKAPAPTAKKAGPTPVYHTVGEGTTLWAVAEKYLGDGNRYMEIFEANRPMLKDPDQLSVGQKLRIPQK